MNAAQARKCAGCPHPEHLGPCFGLNGGTTYRCGCTVDTLPEPAPPLPSPDNGHSAGDGFGGSDFPPPEESEAERGQRRTDAALAEVRQLCGGELERLRAENERLTRGVVANAGRLATLPRVRWAHIVDAVGVGSTTAKALCRDAGFDPDEVVAGREPATCDNCKGQIDGDECATSEVCWDCWREAKERADARDEWHADNVRLTARVAELEQERDSAIDIGDKQRDLRKTIDRTLDATKAELATTAKKAAIAALDASWAGRLPVASAIAEGRLVWDGTAWKAKS